MGTPTPLLGALSGYGHKQLPMRLMGPPHSPQPGIDTLTWCPLVEFWGLYVSQYVFPQCWSGSWRSRHSGPGLQDLRLQVLWIPEGVDGKWENEGLGGVMTQMVGRGEGGSKRWFPSAIHRDLPPQTPLWPPWAFPHPSVSSCCASASSLCASSCFLLAWWSSLKP